MTAPVFVYAAVDDLGNKILVTPDGIYPDRPISDFIIPGTEARPMPDDED